LLNWPRRFDAPPVDTAAGKAIGDAVLIPRVPDAGDAVRLAARILVRIPGGGIIISYPQRVLEGASGMSGTATREYTVRGMTCQHCVASVTEEVSALPGVEAIEVDLESGRLVVTGDVSDDAIGVAVDEAGYQVA
jgi:copper chaperone CopZ